MIARTTLIVIAALGVTTAARAQQGGGDASVRIRAVLHDPAHPVVKLFVIDPDGASVKLNMIPGNLSDAQVTKPVNGTVLFYNSAAINPKNPMEHVAATLKVPQNLKRAIVILIPGPPDSKIAFKTLLIEDTAKSFPKGESKVLSLVNVESAIEAGEHKLQVLPGKLTRVPPVKKLNEFNMAQTNFYYKKEGSWMNFTERQLQFLDEFRRIFIISATPGASQPFISTIVDTAAAPVPNHEGKLVEFK